MPAYRSGDVLDVTLFVSLSESKYNTFRGVVTANMKRNNLRAGFKLHTVVDDVNTTMLIKHNSPLLAKVEVV
jgi:ribosomal protein L19